MLIDGFLTLFCVYKKAKVKQNLFFREFVCNSAEGFKEISFHKKILKDAILRFFYGLFKII
jgi:hypothetical protein